MLGFVLGIALVAFALVNPATAEESDCGTYARNDHPQWVAGRPVDSVAAVAIAAQADALAMTNEIDRMRFAAIAHAAVSAVEAAIDPNALTFTVMEGASTVASFEVEWFEPDPALLEIKGPVALTGGWGVRGISVQMPTAFCDLIRTELATS